MDDDSASIARDCCDTTNAYYAFNGKLMLISLLSLVAVCIIIAFFHSYVRWVQQQRRNRDLRLDEYFSRHRNPRAEYLVFNFRSMTTTTNTNTTTTPRKGLERSVLKSLPTFFYDSAVHDPQLECAVCLSAFGDNVLGRLLPKCNHCFHIDCIDMWFYSHTNCPLCRAPVKPIEDPVQTKISAPETSVSEAGSSSGLRSACTKEGSSSSPPSSEMVVITVEETPTMNPDSGDPKEVDQGFEDPGGLVSSMKTKKADDNNTCKL